jgi:ApbE superfamily uncharacterized protein (UPF0280 family)
LVLPRVTLVFILALPLVLTFLIIMIIAADMVLNVTMDAAVMVTTMALVSLSVSAAAPDRRNCHEAKAIGSENGGDSAVLVRFRSNEKIYETPERLQRVS